MNNKSVSHALQANDAAKASFQLQDLPSRLA